MLGLAQLGLLELGLAELGVVELGLARRARAGRARRAWGRRTRARRVQAHRARRYAAHPQSILSHPSTFNQRSIDLQHSVLTTQYSVEHEYSVNAPNYRQCFTALLCHIYVISKTLARS